MKDQSMAEVGSEESKDKHVEKPTKGDQVAKEQSAMPTKGLKKGVTGDVADEGVVVVGKELEGVGIIPTMKELDL